MSATPSRNATLPYLIGGFESLSAGLDYAAKGQTGCNFFSARGELEQTLPYRDLREQAVSLAFGLAGLDLPRGTRVAMVADTTPEFLVFFFACQYAGLVPVPLPLSVNFGGRAAYEERLSGMIRTARARVAVASADLIDALRNAAAGSPASLVGTHDEFRNLASSRGDLRPLSADEPCYIQYSSGSTSLPRGVLVSQRAVASNADAIARHGLQLVIWRPLRLVVAPVSRHGPGRLLPDAGDDPNLDRLHSDDRIRTTAVDLAQGHIRARGHDLLQPDFRVRAVRAALGRGLESGFRSFAMAGRGSWR